MEDRKYYKKMNRIMCLVIAGWYTAILLFVLATIFL